MTLRRRHSSHRFASPRRRIRAGALALVTLAIFAPSADVAAHDYPSSHVSLEGRGWGHGRGMGQWGAQGYASLKGYSATDILNHFYGNTTQSGVPAQNIRVRLTRFDGADALLTAASGVTVNGAGSFSAARIRRVGTNTFAVDSGPGCGGPWTLAHPGLTNPTITSNGGFLRACHSSGTRGYRGSMQVVDESGTARLVNDVNLEDYLKGAVPREMPASFHLEALKAQAVAARSYALAENRSSLYKTCDTTSCQVYGGAELNEVVIEHPNTNAAVDATAGRVRLLNGAVARMEYSSSTGGHTVNGTFPAVVDEGDTVSGNPNHAWQTSIAVSTIESAYPQIGSLQRIDITERNGLGDFGGRVKKLVLVGSAGSVTLTGDQFRSKFGLKSDWFNILNNPSGGLAGYWIVARDGGIFSFGDVAFHGSTGNIALAQPIVGMTRGPGGTGYWLVGADGGVFTFGNLAFHGSTGNMRLNAPVLGMAAHPSGGGYWTVASDGGIFAFGNVGFYGSTGAMRLNQPVVGMAPTPSGNGYWLVAKDGGIFAFGDAGFYGSTGAMALNQPVVGMASTPSGNGYWLVAADGGLFAFGDAGFANSVPGIGARDTIVGMAATATGGGYIILGTRGNVYAFGDAPSFGGVTEAVPGYTGGALDIETVPLTG